MSDLNGERTKPWDIYTASNPSPSQAGGVDEETAPWKSLGTSMNAISFGFVATAILISMFLIMAIFEHLFKPTPQSLLATSQESVPSGKHGNTHTKNGDDGDKDVMKKHRRQVLYSGIITAIGINLHNFPEGMAVFLDLWHISEVPIHSKTKALKIRESSTIQNHSLPVCGKLGFFQNSKSSQGSQHEHSQQNIWFDYYC